jgi:26S proteasome regulatory subunit N7
LDTVKAASMREKNAARLKELDDKIADAETNMGEQEVKDALLAKAEHLALLGDREAATKAFEVTEAKTSGVGNKMDLVFSQIR